GCDHLVMMQGMRRGQQHSVDGVVLQDAVKAVGQRDVVRVAENPGADEVGLDRLHDVEPATGARGLHERAAPASEPGDRTVDHAFCPQSLTRARSIAAMMAALSLSGPSSAIAARSSAIWTEVIGRCRSRA